MPTKSEVYRPHCMLRFCFPEFGGTTLISTQSMVYCDNLQQTLQSHIHPSLSHRRPLAETDLRGYWVCSKRKVKSLAAHDLDTSTNSKYSE
ncbi:hypothetical protein KIN20_012732 [Parelaphostrongylus tenuis]|uniref:Uncharacterized protein n=1 Tax=Parelaphostrongylus tenuis TaxID=148309 RepID=A0AAD5MCK3_PARTN|nr:hypothetical protein KIN20_012732 [Parelaphostrongylus tenuis]